MSDSAKYCIQCQDSKTGKTGDFLFMRDNPKVAISPVFESVYHLLSWMKQNEWESVPDGEWNDVQLVDRTNTKSKPVRSINELPQKNGTFRYVGNDNFGKPKANYLAEIAKMDDKTLEDTGEQMVWLSAFANNNPRSDFHWQVDAIYDECQKREKPEIYTRAFDRAKRACGFQ